MYRLVALIVTFCALLFGVYEMGKMAERAIWQSRVAEAQQQADAQLSRQNVITARISNDYEGKLAALNRSFTQRMRDASRPRETGTTQTTCEPVDQTLGLENERRFESNKLQLLELQEWVTTLFGVEPATSSADSTH